MHESGPWRSLARGSLAIWLGSISTLTALGLAWVALEWPLSAAEQTASGSSRVPVIFVPGVTGVELRQAGSAKIVWGRGHNLILPRDRGYATARAIEAGPARSRVEAGEVILRLRLAGVVRKPVYQPLVDLLEGNGYRLGDLNDPRREASLYLFGYDWRQSNVESARRLLERLEQVRLARGESRLAITLVCQSNGAHLCRYLTRYGAAPLQEVEDGRGGLPSTLEIRKLVLLGASNGGSIRILRELNRGRQYIRCVGRRWAPETLFTYESLYEDLPAYTEDLFVDETGRPISVDLYDVASWIEYRWSVFAPAVASRLAEDRHPDLFGDATARQAFVERALERSRRFHRLLGRDAGGSLAARYYLVRNDFNPTPARALLVRAEQGWKTFFVGDAELKRYPSVAPRLAAAGDGHATSESQQWLSEAERERLSPRVINVGGTHFEMIHNPEAQRHLLEILAESIAEGPAPSL